MYCPDSSAHLHVVPAGTITSRNTASPTRDAEATDSIVVSRRQFEHDPSLAGHRPDVEAELGDAERIPEPRRDLAEVAAAADADRNEPLAVGFGVDLHLDRDVVPIGREVQDERVVLIGFPCDGVAADLDAGVAVDLRRAAIAELGDGIWPGGPRGSRRAGRPAIRSPRCGAGSACAADAPRRRRTGPEVLRVPLRRVAPNPWDSWCVAATPGAAGPLAVVGIDLRPRVLPAAGEVGPLCEVEVSQAAPDDRAFLRHLRRTGRSARSWTCGDRS